MSQNLSQLFNRRQQGRNTFLSMYNKAVGGGSVCNSLIHMSVITEWNSRGFFKALDVYFPYCTCKPANVHLLF